MSETRPDKGTFAVDLVPGERITGFFLVRLKKLEPFRDRTKGEYLTLHLSDRTGHVLARVWEGAPALAEAFDEGDIVKIIADVEEYMGRTQLVVQRLRPAAEGEYVLADFLAATARDLEALLAEVQSHVEALQDPHLAALARHFYADPAFVAQLREAPASRRLHRAYLGGLLEHLAQMLALCDTVSRLYPELDGDLLRTGALMLAAGSLRVYTRQPDVDYTDAGRLLGHVILSDENLTAALTQLPDFPAELALRLRHLVASYRGRYDWGAPREPMTLEAIALHHIENLNTQIGRFRDLLSARREAGQSWTAFDRLLGRQLYAGGDPDEHSDQADPE